MKTIRLGIHSLVLVIVDMIGIVGGAIAAHQITGVHNQVQWQLPIAVVLSIGLFVAWILFLRAFGFKQIQLVETKESWFCWGLSIVWGQLLFVPLHYSTQGYLTDIGNLFALVLYQLPVNALVLILSAEWGNLRNDKHTYSGHQ